MNEFAATSLHDRRKLLTYCFNDSDRETLPTLQQGHSPHLLPGESGPSSSEFFTDEFLANWAASETDFEKALFLTDSVSANANGFI